MGESKPCAALLFATFHKNIAVAFHRTVGSEDIGQTLKCYLNSKRSVSYLVTEKEVAVKA